MDYYKPPYTLTSKMVNLISKISEELTRVEHNKKAIFTPRLRKINRVKTLTGTLEIEGNFLGEEKITAILEGKRVLGTMLELAEVDGAIKAYKELKKYNYTEMDELLRAHKLLMDKILTTAGNFRNINVGVGGKDGITHVAPQPAIVPKLMKDLFDWLKNTDEHALIKSCVFHYEFEFIHPFSDGNGRIGRLWQTIILYNWKKVFNSIPTESIIKDNQSKYYKALKEAGSKGESTPFIEFMLEVILKTIKKQVIKSNLRNIPRNVPKKNQNSNQESNLKSDQKIITLIDKNNNITINEICKIISLSQSGVKKVIKKLKSENKIKRVGSLKGGHWEIIEANNK